MPGTSTKTEQTTVRLPVDLLEWIKTQSGSKAEVIAAALAHLKDGPVVVEASERVAELEAENRDLQRKLMDALKALVDAKHPASNAEGRRLARGADPMGRSAHPAGPVLATTAPEVAGQTGWCGLKGLDKAKR